MTYTFAEAGKDAERIENFLQRLAKAREIFRLVGDAEVRIEQLKASGRVAKGELEALRTRFSVAKTLSDEKVKAFGEVAAAAKAEADLAQKDARDRLDALAAEIAAARVNAKASLAFQMDSFDSLIRSHDIRIAEMAEVEQAKRTQIAEADQQLQAIIQKISPSGD